MVRTRIELQRDRTDVHLSGELDVFTTWQLDTALNAATRAAQPVTLDLSGLTCCDSSGVAALDVWQRRCELDGIELNVTGARGIVARVLEWSSASQH
jgi:anti-sigma B factor antagonist